MLQREGYLVLGPSGPAQGHLENKSFQETSGRIKAEGDFAVRVDHGLHFLGGHCFFMSAHCLDPFFDLLLDYFLTTSGRLQDKDGLMDCQGALEGPEGRPGGPGDPTNS